MPCSSQWGLITKMILMGLGKQPYKYIYSITSGPEVGIYLCQNVSNKQQVVYIQTLCGCIFI